MARGPHFLCIGMQCSGTSFLYDLMNASHAYWMPPIKEFHHFNGAARTKLDVFEGYAARALKARRKLGATGANPAHVEKRLRAQGDLKKLFFLRYADYRDADCSNATYLTLFEPCPEDRFTGDITPAYSTLDREAIASVDALLPEVRVILVIREPVSRAWSQLNRRVRQELTQRGKRPMEFEILQATMDRLIGDPSTLDAFLSSDGLDNRGFPTRILGNWEAVVSRDRVMTVLFEDLVQEPVGTLSALTRFVGAARPDSNHETTTPDQERARIVAVGNRKEKLARMTMEAAHRDRLVAHFADELKACRQILGARVQPWLDLYGL